MVSSGATGFFLALARLSRFQIQGRDAAYAGYFQLLVLSFAVGEAGLKVRVLWSPEFALLAEFL